MGRPERYPLEQGFERRESLLKGEQGYCIRQLAPARPDLKRTGDETKAGSRRDDAPVRII